MSSDILPGYSTIGNRAGGSLDEPRTGRISQTAPAMAGQVKCPHTSNLEAVSEAAARELPPVPPAGGFLTAHGAYDSHAVALADGKPNGSHLAGTPYGRISWAEIGRLVAVPAAVPKDRAQLVILSTYAECDGRTHAVQTERGVYGGLAVDIDKGSPTFEQVVDALRRAVGPVAGYVYSSSSAEPGEMKWRILLPLAASLAGADYADTQLALFELLEAEGLVCDSTLSRSAQPVYLPNVPPKRRGPDGRPLFYRGELLTGHRLEVVPGSAVYVARQALRDRKEQERAEAAAKAAAYQSQRLARIAQTGDDFQPIEHFNANHSISDLLRKYGFTPKQTRRGIEWKSPRSTSGSYSTQDRGDHWVTVSEWARRDNVGWESSGGHRYGDAFALYVAFEHAGDRREAVRAYAQLVRPTLPKRADAAPVRIEPYAAPSEPVPLEQWRRELEAAVALEAERPGIKLLRGAPGTGKTYAVARAMAGRSGGLEAKAAGVVSVPGHEFAGELVAELRALGMDAAAYPKLDEHTCRYWEKAEYAQASGLPVTATVCGLCPHKRECRQDGYLALVQVAEQAPHKVCTHERLARQSARLTENAAYVTVEEDPSKLLRPSVSTTARQLELFAALADELAEAEQRARILDGIEPAVPVAERFDEFAAWEQAASGDPSEPGEQAEPAGVTFHVRQGFLHRLCSLSRELARRCRDAVRDGTPAGVHAIELPQVVDLPKNPEGAVWHALEKLQRTAEGGVPLVPREALTLALYAATGRLERLYLQVDEDTRPGRPASRIVHVVGFWRTALPWDRVPVWVNDGTIEPETLEQLTGAAVVDVTPCGELELAKPAVQYAYDILPTTSSAKVGRILAGIARDYPEAERIAVILFKRHREELLFPEDGRPRLPADVLERIALSTYHGAGNDRGSNHFHRQADLVITLGTLRPPPSEIRRALVRRGQLEAANAGGTWGRIERRAGGADGGIVTYSGRGYAEALWAAAADGITRANARQTVGRARAICSDGVPVVAVTTESTGLPVRPAEELPAIDEQAERVLEALTRISESVSENASGDPPGPPANCAQKPYKSLIGKMGAVGPAPGATLEELLEALPGVPYATLRKWINRAVEAGHVAREGSTTATRYRLLRGRPAASTPQTIAPPPVVPETDGEPPWLKAELEPARHPATLSEVRWLVEFWRESLQAGEPAWEREITPPLVLSLHRAAVVAAEARGQPPPPVEVVARHTASWHAVTIGAA